MEQEFLYKELATIRKYGGIKKIPEFIIQNLSSNIELRDYQKETFENSITFFENPEISKNKKKHLLYHMATGSGKTVIMAGMMLYLYSLGYKRFVFFVNAKNIVNKTIDNFTNKEFSKYLFSKNIEINGKSIIVKQVSNFQHIDDDAINICFTTIQGLHLDLWNPKENSLTLSDFEDEKVVLISDEAHHINAVTSQGKKLSKEDKENLEDNKSWESSVARVFDANIDSVMLEFTATCDLRNENIKLKYTDKIVYDYPLSKFRESGYTKEFLNYQSNTDLWDRTLQAILISQYRMKLFQQNKINIKPVVLLKSQKISESVDFYNEFFEKLKTLSSNELLKIKENNINNNLITRIFTYFEEHNILLENLAEELKIDFSKEHSVLMNDKNTLTDEMQKQINSLEDISNPYRLLFTVDMLNEGWDVLNLFDIVRLYDTRQGGANGSVSNYTIKEAQLIGRGARYCPFQFSEEQIKYKRKYDNDIDSLYRICETMLYHSKQDSKYIDELRRALKETGLLPKNEPTEVIYELKESFKQEAIYKQGYLFTNERRIKSKQDTELPDKLKYFGMEYNCIQNKYSGIFGLFDTSTISKTDIKTISTTKKIKELPYNIVYKAMRKFNNLKFSYLKEKFPTLKSSKEFLTSEHFAGNMQIIFKFQETNRILNEDIYQASLLLMNELSTSVSKIKYLYEGTKNFIGVPIIQAIPPRKKRQLNQDLSDKNGMGVSQNSPNVDEKYRIDLSKEDWYAFNDNFGTSEEKSFVKYLSTIINKLKEKYTKVFLLRNEQVFSIYSFNTGDKFEPDYVLLLSNEDSTNPIYCQIFIEPKGTQLLQTDSWKNEFLLNIHKEGLPIVKFEDDNEYCIWGLPFYNEEYCLKEFTEAIEKFYE